MLLHPSQILDNLFTEGFIPPSRPDAPARPPKRPWYVYYVHGDESAVFLAKLEERGFDLVEKEGYWRECKCVKCRAKQKEDHVLRRR